MPETAETVSLSIQTFVALCALASLKNDRGTYLIKNVPDTERDIRALIQRRVIRGVRCEDDDVTSLVSRINSLGSGRIQTDQYDTNRLAIDEKAVLLFQGWIADELRFGGTDMQDLIFTVAGALGAPDIPQEVAKKITDKLQRFQSYAEKFARNHAFRRMLAVLIPLACISVYDKLFIYQDTPEDVTRHQKQCHYCKQYFEIMQVTIED